MGFMKQFITFGHHLGWNMNIPGLFESRLGRSKTHVCFVEKNTWLEHHQNKFLLAVLSPFSFGDVTD